MESKLLKSENSVTCPEGSTGADTILPPHLDLPHLLKVLQNLPSAMKSANPSYHPVSLTADNPGRPLLFLRKHQ